MMPRTNSIQIVFLLLILLSISLYLFADIVFFGKMFTHGDYLSPLAVKIGVEKYIYQYGGEYPYWLPSMMFGIPSVHSFQNISSYYPPQYIIEFLRYLGMPVFWNYIFHILFGGLGMYMLLRKLDAGYYAASLSSIAFIFNPYMVAMIMTGHGSQMMTSVYIPWIFYAYFLIISQCTYRNIGIFALFVSFQLLRGHVQIAYYTWIALCLVMASRFIYSYIVNRRVYIKEILSICAGLIIGLLGSMSIYLPSLYYKTQSIRDGYSFSDATGWSFSFIESITLLIPSYFGFGGRDSYFGPMGLTDFPNFIGPIVLVFAISALFYCKKQTRYDFLVVSLVFFMLSLGKNSLIYQLFFDYFPFFDAFRAPMMLLIVFQFSICVLFGLGLSRVIDVISEKKNDITSLFEFRTISFISFIFIVIYFANGLVSYNQYLDSIIEDQVSINSEAIKNIAMDRDENIEDVKTIVKANFKDKYLSNPARFKSAHADIRSESIFGIISLILVVGGLFLRGKCNSIYPMIIAMVILYGLIYVDNRILGPETVDGISFRDSYIDEQDEVIKLLMDDQDIFRVFHTLPWSNRLSAFMIEDVNGYHAAKLKGYNDFSSIINSFGLSSGLLDLMNVKYILSTENVSRYLQFVNLNPIDGYSTSIGDYKVYIYKNNNFLPRAFFVSTIVGVTDKDHQLSILSNEAFNPITDSYIDSKFDKTQYNPLEATVQSIDKTANSITVSVDCISNQFLVVSDTYYNNGWSATLNGEDITIHEVDGVFRGVEVPPGNGHIIEMKFSPSDIYTGNILSIVGFFLVVCLIFLSPFMLNKD